MTRAADAPPRWPFLVLLLVLLAVAGEVPFWGWHGHNGDHFYYAAMGLQFAGSSYDHALTTATSYFQYQHPASTLDWGFLNPQVAPLIYPRTVLPLVAAPFLWLFGMRGIWVPGVLFGLATLLLLHRTTRRSFGPAAGVAVVVLALMTAAYTELSFGVYSEAPMLTVLAVMVTLLPLDHERRSWREPLALALLVVLLTFVRQVVVVPLALVAAGWLHARLQRGRWRNAWSPYVLAVVVGGAVSTLLASRWAPYDPMAFLRTSLHASSTSGVLARIPGAFGHAMSVDLGRALRHDRMELLLPLLAVLGSVRVRRTVWPWLAAAAFAAGLLLTALNGTPSYFRYLAPSFPLVLPLAAIGVLELLRLAGFGRVGTARPAEAPSRRPWLALGGAAAALVLTVGATAWAYQPASLAGAPRRHVSSSTVQPWPLTTPSGTLVCAGTDDEVWFRAPSGQLYAFSGTAMARSFRAPRALSLAREKHLSQGWDEARSLLAEGIALCRARRR